MQEFKIRLGKSLVVLSFIILLIGVSFSMNSNIVVEVIDNGNSGISIIPNTTIDGHNNNYLSNNNTNDTDTNKNSSNNSSNNSNASSSNNSSIGNNSGYSDNSNETTNSNNISTKKESDSDLVIKYDYLRKNIENNYNIKVYFGDETDNYSVGGLATTSITSESVVYNSLLSLQRNLSLYPSGMLDEIASKGLPLSVYLIQRYSSSNVTGITERRESGVNISIACDFSFNDSFNHEMYHYMEHYIYDKGGSYTNWNNYNPTGFSYGNYDNSTVYDLTFSSDSYFVNSYSQSYDYEDRASTFEYMMADNKISPLNEGNHIWAKAVVISETIDYYFDCVNSSTTEYWERFVY